MTDSQKGSDDFEELNLVHNLYGSKEDPSQRLQGEMPCCWFLDFSPVKL